MIARFGDSAELVFVKRVVFAEPDNRETRELLVNALTQLGYRAESGPGRNFYLTGAKELRDGVVVLPTPTSASPDVTAAMPTSLILDYLAICLRHEDAADLVGTTLLRLTYIEERYLIELSNGVRHHRAVSTEAEVSADATLTTTRGRLNEVLTLDDPTAAFQGEEVTISGDPSSLLAVVHMLDDFPFWFDIVTP